MKAAELTFPSEFADRVRKVVAETQRLPFEAVRLETRLSDIGMDSHDRISLLFAVETEFDLIVPNEVGEIQTVQELAVGVLQLLAAQSKPEDEG